MRSVPLPELLAAGAVRRWHTQAVRHEQTVAAHSWGVALIALRLAGAEAPAEGRAQLLLLGLLHDAHEGTFGDTPYRAKALLRSQGIDLDGRCAEAFWGPGGLDGAFAPWVRNLVAVADQLEAVAFASQNAPELAPLVAQEAYRCLCATFAAPGQEALLARAKDFLIQLWRR